MGMMNKNREKVDASQLEIKDTVKKKTGTLDSWSLRTAWRSGP